MWDASGDAMTYRGSIVGCPDPERLAQLATDTLSDDDRGALLDHAATCSECHAAVAVVADQPTRTPPPLPVARIDRYELRRIVGVGAMGVVYAAFDPELDREVAVKVLRPNASAARLRREAQALAKLADPNVVRVYDVGEQDGKTFVAMELVEGENLREWLRTPHALDEIVSVLIHAGRGLGAAPRAGVVDRDIKPHNLMI
jgi:RIO-like serine/threonine protein kinase